MAKQKHKDGTQFASLPFRVSADGSCQIMLVTSRGTHRWIIPKGWPIKGLRAFEAAAQEAYEEAGLIGHMVHDRPFGSYDYDKALPGRSLRCAVGVFLLRVDRQTTDWPEKTQRETRWFDPAEAADLVNEHGLADVIRRFASAHPLHVATAGPREADA